MRLSRAIEGLGILGRQRVVGQIIPGYGASSNQRKLALAHLQLPQVNLSQRAFNSTATLLSQEVSLKAKLQGSQIFCGYGIFLMSASPIVAELLGHAGYDFLVVDLEHSPADEEVALRMLQAIKAARKPALLRVASNRPELIKKALDIGPAGVIVPLVDSVDDARAVAAACRYPPKGMRGVAPSLVRASAWGADSAYAQNCEDNCLVLCQVETAGGVESTEDILHVDGIDGVFVGPIDLSAALGQLGNVAHPDVKEAIQKIETAAAKHPRKILGGFAGGRDPKDMFKIGYRLVASSADMVLLREAASADIARIS